MSNQFEDFYTSPEPKDSKRAGSPVENKNSPEGNSERAEVVDRTKLYFERWGDKLKAGWAGLENTLPLAVAVMLSRSVLETGGVNMDVVDWAKLIGVGLNLASAAYYFVTNTVDHERDLRAARERDQNDIEKKSRFTQFIGKWEDRLHAAALTAVPSLGVIAAAWKFDSGDWLIRGGDVPNMMGLAIGTALLSTAFAALDRYAANRASKGDSAAIF